MSKMIHYCVVEPHADDAFLSLHDHMVSWVKDGHKVTIVTVFTDKRRREEAEKYAKAVNVKSMCLDFSGGMQGLQGASHLPKFEDWGLDSVVNGKNVKYVFPLGLQHPDHKTVSGEAVQGSLFYLDTPYQAKQKNHMELHQRTCGNRIVSIRFPSKRKWRHTNIFKSQAKFYYYNPPETMLKIPEMIVKVFDV